METFYVLKSGLILHLAGIAMMVGLTVASFAAYQLFWKFVAEEKTRRCPFTGPYPGFSCYRSSAEC